MWMLELWVVAEEKPSRKMGRDTFIDYIALLSGIIHPIETSLI
jgi:hypothetical protein